MKRVIIWGCGRYGRYLYNAIKKYYSSRIAVVGMADTRYEEYNSMIARGERIFDDEIMNNEICQILGYVQIKELYDTGKIDGVIIGVLKPEIVKKIEDVVSILGIELIDLRHNDRVYIDEYAKQTYRIFNDRISVSIAENIYLFSHETWSGDYKFSYLFTEDDKVIQETDRYLSLPSALIDDIFLPYTCKKNIKKIIDKAVSLLQLGSDFNYGHFVFSCLGKICALEDAGYDGKYILYESNFARQWVDILRQIYPMDDNRFIWINYKQTDKVFKIKELHCMQNIVDTSALNARLIDNFASKVIGIYEFSKNDNRKYYSRIYLRRSCGRRLIGCEEILSRYGFVTVEPEKMSVKEQVDLISHADAVFAAYGAAVTNCAFMRPQSILITASGGGFVDLFFIEMIKIRKIKYRMLVGQKEYAVYDVQEDYMLHPTLLEITLEDVLSK